MCFQNNNVARIINVNECNIVVLKTHAGLANALAVGIDAMHLEEVLGCVAGDDTILLVSRSEESARHIANRFRDMIKN